MEQKDGTYAPDDESGQEKNGTCCTGGNGGGRPGRYLVRWEHERAHTGPTIGNGSILLYVL